MSSAFGLNNIPAGLAKRVEVYKGVVPIELGGDALGGAINIVTDDSRRTRVNASYSFGSFNTHKTNVYAEHTTKKGFYAFHTGSWGGMTTKVLYFLAAFIGGILPLSGYYLWLKKKRRPSRKKEER